jgi:hypothetical protein
LSDAEQALPNPEMEGPPASSGRDVSLDPESLARHYEADDIQPGPIVWFTVGLLIAIAIALVFLWWLVGVWADRPIDVSVQLPPALTTPPAVPGPGLDAQPESELGILLQRESERLNSYGWVDRDAGVVHIPIDRAMELLVESGLPAVEGSTPTFGLDSAFRLDSSGGIEPTADEDLDEEGTGGGGTDEGSTDGGSTENATPEGGVIDSGVTDENATRGDATDGADTDASNGETGDVIDSDSTDENATRGDAADGDAAGAGTTDDGSTDSSSTDDE